MTTPQPGSPNGQTDKQAQLDAARVDPAGTYLTTQHGVRVDSTDDSLRVGERGPTLLEDFHFREKMNHFDHERIPERIVHARGAGAHGHFRVYDDALKDVTIAGFLTDPGRSTPVFVRFSTVGGSRGSADTPRDVRGFATKFYTEEGNYDLVGNNMPVFFIQDGIKFPDFVHAVKPEPDNEIPQASSAHDTLWDFVSLVPESLHMMMWLMSDRAIPRSYRMMEGFGVHTYRFVNAEGRAHFVKFHWKPALGVSSLVWDEAQSVAGKDADFNRRDLWEAIESGAFPEWELGVQVIPEEDEFAFDFDLLDATKLVPEEQVPVQRVGRLILDRNPDNFFAETEQIAFNPANVVPGIDFTNDPLLQARLFSYQDTQLIRLGGPNWAQIPINRPVAPVANNQRDGYGQQQVPKGKVSYSPNSLGDGCPMVAGAEHGGYQHYQERVEGHTIRRRSPSFEDHYSQATLFWNSGSDWEREHIVAAFRFELGKLTYDTIRERILAHLAEIDGELATKVAEGLGMTAPVSERQNAGQRSPALSLANLAETSLATRKVALLAADGVDDGPLRQISDALTAEGAICEVLAPHGGSVRTADGGSLPVDRAISTMASVLYDAVLVAGGETAVQALARDGEARHYVAQAFKHGKAVGAIGDGVELVRSAPLGDVRTAGLGEAGVVEDRGVVTLSAGDGIDDFVGAFVGAVAGPRHFDRADESVPA